MNFYKNFFSRGKQQNKYKLHFESSIKSFTAKLLTFTATGFLFLSGITSPANITKTFAADISTLQYKIADLDVIVSIPTDLVTFTRRVTDNNQYLQLIGADSAIELRSNMEANNVYIETIPKENVTYEFILSGTNASSDARQFNELSEAELNSTFEEYVKACDNIENSIATEKVNSSSIEKIGDTVYFVTDITSVANNLVTVQIKKYYTCMQGKNISFTIQTTEPAITDEMSSLLSDIVSSASYTAVNSSIFDNALLTDILATVFTLLVPIGILFLIVLILTKSTKKKKIKR